MNRNSIQKLPKGTPVYPPQHKLRPRGIYDKLQLDVTSGRLINRFIDLTTALCLTAIQFLPLLFLRTHLLPLGRIEGCRFFLLVKRDRNAMGIRRSVSKQS